MWIRFPYFLFVGLLALICSTPTLAHPEGFSGLRILIWPDRARAVLTLHTRDMSRWFPWSKYPDYVNDVSRALEAKSGELLDLRADGQLLTATKANASSPEVGMIEVDIDYLLPAGATHLEVWSKHLVMLPRGHQQLLFFEHVPSGSTLGEQTLTSEEDAGAVDLPATHAATSPTTTSAGATTSPNTRPAPRRLSFFMIGLGHIVTGYDHLLFLAALLLVCKTLREAAAVITFFTVAHSITLTLATLDIVRLGNRVVEPAIAASIVYVGLENIFGKHRFATRAAITFAFGLVHGLGYASALREVGLGSSSVGLAMPLLKFSAGLETGQLCIATVFLAVMLRVRKHPGFEKRVVPACSILVSLLGAYWLVTRLMSG